MNTILDESIISNIEEAEKPIFVEKIIYTLHPFLKVALLSKEDFTRGCDPSNTIAVHCLTPKKFEEKVETFKQHSLWLLDNDFNF